jgi:hypothetical protein
MRVTRSAGVIVCQSKATDGNQHTRINNASATTSLACMPGQLGMWLLGALQPGQLHH